MPATQRAGVDALWPSAPTRRPIRRANCSTCRSRSPTSAASCAVPSSSPCSSPNMAEIADDLRERHLAGCGRFGETVTAANGKWDRPSACDAWDARGVLEHVIGFHDMLLLRPLGLKPDRHRDDPELRWGMTYGQQQKAFKGDRLLFELV